MNVLVFGEVLWDIYPEVQYVGGAPLNFAAHFKKCGGNSQIVTAVGCDSLGDNTISEIKKLGIDTKYICRAECKTGECLVSLNENGIPSYNLLDNVAYDYIQAPGLEGKLFDALYFGTLSLRHENNMDLLKKIISTNSFKEIFLDVNIRSPYYCKEVIKFSLKNSTVVKISEEELPIVMQLLGEGNSSAVECAKIISSNFENINMIVVTKGDKGSLVYECNSQKIYERNAQNVNVISTVGAGDSFSAAFSARYLMTYNIVKALDFATKISGYVVSRKESIPDYKVEDFA